MANKPLLCKIFGHKTDDSFQEGNPRFEKYWNKLLNEPMWYENFFHKCIRENCEYGVLVSRWTKAAARKMLQDEDSL